MYIEVMFAFVSKSRKCKLKEQIFLVIHYNEAERVGFYVKGEKYVT